MRIGILGTGTITSALVTGIAEDGHQITVSARNADKAAALAMRFDNVQIAPNQQVVDNSDVVFLGLLASHAPTILRALSFRPDQKVVSLMAGLSLAEVDALVVPARCEAVMMPFPGIAQGNSPIMAQGDTALLEQLFAPRNRVYALKDEAELDAYLCAQAVLSVATQMVAGASDWLGARVSDPAQAEGFLRDLVGSSLAATECHTLLAALSTPGGFNERLRIAMEDAGTPAALIRALNDLEAS